MTLEHGLLLIVGLLWLVTVAQGVASLADGLSFRRFVNRALRDEALRRPDCSKAFTPRAVVILPCCGVDERLHQTVERLGRQNYEVVFAFESMRDPAFAAVRRWTKDWTRPFHRCVIAGLADKRAQKIHNLLAAVQRCSPDREVLVFLDSDAVPHPEWLAQLVAPLADPGVGAATGYRWYTAAGGFAEGVRCCWNAATVTLLHDERHNFCWGGSTAIRRRDFDGLGIRRHWDRALSDDYQITRAVREAGLAIRFVPQALIPSRDRVSFGEFWSFATRQLVITRVCGPHLWRTGFLLCLSFTLGGAAIFMLFLAAALGWIGNQALMWTAFAGWLVILAFASAKALVRQLAIRKLLRPPAVTWRDFLWDVVGVNLSGLLHMALMLASLRSRRFVWRNTIYEMISADETRILGRVESGVSVAAAPAPQPSTTH